jgi:predicted PP-loop superfamily ATPase
MARAEMAKAAADSKAFERRLKERLEQRLAGRRRFQAHDNDGVWVEEVRLEGSYPDTTGLIILRDDR